MRARVPRAGFIDGLRRRFVAGAMAAVALVLVVIIAGMNVVNYVSLTQQADVRLAYIAQCGGRVPYVSGDTSKKPTAEAKKKLHEYGLTYEMLFELRYFTAEFADDGSLASLDTERIVSVDEDEARALASSVIESGRTEGFSGTYRFAVSDAGDRSGLRRVIFLDCRHDLGKFTSYLVASAGAGVAGLLVMLLLVVAFSRVILRPVVESYEKQRRFITDASHEIKTPLAIIDAANEVLQIEQGPSEWADSIHEQVERLSGLTGHLVQLSRMDEGADRLTIGPLDLAQLVREASEPFHLLAEGRGKSLALHLPAHLEVQGDAAALSQAIGLLLDNAVRYAREGASIEISLEARGHGARLDVSNPVEQMLQGNIDLLFERFYRPDTSRSSETGGSGIGLSIVRAIAEAHGGAANVSASGDIITFTIILP